MSLSNCPHCSSPIPPAFASMPVCSICGGDVSAAPANGPVWAAVDIKTDNTRTCQNCGENIKSILAMECPNCGSELSKPGIAVQDIEKEKQAFEAAVQASQAPPAEELPQGKTCPHCSHSIPADFVSMPVCYICGGDLSVVPESGPVWAAVDIRTDNTRTCQSCGESVKSILAMQCPSCGSELAKPGTLVEDIEKEKQAFEAAVQASQAPPAEVEYVSEEAEEEQMPEIPPISFVHEEPSEPEPQIPTVKYIHVEPSISNVRPHIVPPVIEPSINKTGNQNQANEFDSPAQRREAVRKELAKKKESFWTKLLRLFGLKKD